MKNSIFLIAIGLILLTGCSKEESNEQFEEQTIDSVYVLKQINGETTWETTSVDGLQTGTDFTYTSDDRSRRGQTIGEFIPTYRDAVVITWSGTEDETGAYGSAELQMSTPAYSFHFILETECVTVNGNSAVYGGIVTEVLESSGNPPPFGVNWRFYFEVKDAAQGRSVNYDQISGTKIFASPMSPSLCHIQPGNRLLSSQGYEDVLQPGFVEVSNNPQ